MKGDTWSRAKKEKEIGPGKPSQRRLELLVGTEKKIGH